MTGRPSKDALALQEQAVELERASHMTVVEVARDLSIDDTTSASRVMAGRHERGTRDVTDADASSVA